MSTVLFRYAELILRKASQMYEIFEKLCDLKGITPYKFCKDTGVNTSTISTWKKNNSKCKPYLAEKVCTYFGVSHDYLMTGKESEKEQYSTEMAMLVRKIRNDKEMSQALIKYFGLSDEKKKHVVDMINMLSEV